VSPPRGSVSGGHHWRAARADRVTGDLDRPRRPATRHRRPKHRSTPRRSRIRRALRREPSPRLIRQTTRHRLNYGGDRQANRTLHLIAVCRLRYCPRTRAYARRRTAEGKTKPEILRCLKRYIARRVNNTIRADLADLHQPQLSARTTTIICGAGPIGITRRRT
jgi:hypothetical protein